MMFETKFRFGRGTEGAWRKKMFFFYYENPEIIPIFLDPPLTRADTFFFYQSKLCKNQAVLPLICPLVLARKIS